MLVSTAAVSYSETVTGMKNALTLGRATARQFSPRLKKLQYVSVDAVLPAWHALGLQCGLGLESISVCTPMRMTFPYPRARGKLILRLG